MRRKAAIRKLHESVRLTEEVIEALSVVRRPEPEGPEEPPVKDPVRPEPEPEPEPIREIRTKRETIVGEQWIMDGTISYSNVDFRGGYRSSIFTASLPWATEEKKKNFMYHMMLDSCNFTPDIPNLLDGSDTEAHTGTLWASRQTGIRSCNVKNVDIIRHFGNSYESPPQYPLVTQQEGHGFYFHICPTKDSLFIFTGCTWQELGGHALHFVTSLDPARAKFVPADLIPEWGGKLILQDCDISNTDRCPSRGSASIHLFDTRLDVTLDSVHIDCDSDSPNWGWKGPGTKEFLYRSRGLIMCKGETGTFTVKNSFLFQAQPADRNLASFRGPREIFFTDTKIPQGMINFNSGGSYNDRYVKSRTVTFRGCTGSAKIAVDGKVIGTVSEDKVYDLV